jgi:hypothetical protein
MTSGVSRTVCQDGTIWRHVKYLYLYLVSRIQYLSLTDSYCHTVYDTLSYLFHK